MQADVQKIQEKRDNYLNTAKDSVDNVLFDLNRLVVEKVNELNRVVNEINNNDEFSDFDKTDMKLDALKMVDSINGIIDALGLSEQVSLASTASHMGNTLDSVIKQDLK